MPQLDVQLGQLENGQSVSVGWNERRRSEFWMNLQQRYELEAARRAVGSAVERKVVAIDLVG